MSHCTCALAWYPAFLQRFMNLDIIEVLDNGGPDNRGSTVYTHNYDKLHFESIVHSKLPMRCC